MTSNPIHELLNLTPGTEKTVITIDGRGFEIYPAREGTYEGMYRIDAGYGVPNPCFSLAFAPKSHRAMALGQYLAKPRDGVNRAEAEEITTRAAAERQLGYVLPLMRA